jgi:hypothetical protein
MKESWRFSSVYAGDCRLTGELCTHVEHGEGSASIQLHSRRPYDVLVSPDSSSSSKTSRISAPRDLAHAKLSSRRAAAAVRGR